MPISLPPPQPPPDNIPRCDATKRMCSTHVRATEPHVDPPGSCRINEYVFVCYYEEDVARFTQLCAVDGAHICGVLDVPFWNAWGKVVGTQHLIVYQHDRELEMEVLT